jgi:hypothetical protein
MFADLIVNNSISTVHRFVYGATFSEFELFPNAGASEGTECRPFLCLRVTNVYQKCSASRIWEPIQPKQFHGGRVVENNADHLGTFIPCFICL